MILLDAYAARSCPVKTQHSFDPLAERPEVPEDHAMTELFAGAQAFKDEVLAPLALLGAAGVVAAALTLSLKKDEPGTAPNESSEYKGP